MAQLIFNIPTFVLTSKWTVGNTPEGLKMTTPTTHSLDQQLSLSGFPSGSTINSAILYVEREWGDTGGKQDKINNTNWDTDLGSWRAEENITELVRANVNGVVTLNFKWQANGTISWGAGNKKSQLNYKLVRVTVDYTPGKSTATLNESSVIANDNATVTVTVTPHNVTYSHVVKMYPANHPGSTIVTNLAPGITTTSVVIPKNWCSHITNSTQGEALCSVETFNGSESLGVNTYSFSVIVPDNVVPNVSLSLETLNALQGTALKGISKAKIIASASGIYGSTITHYQFSGAGYSGSGNPWTSGAINSTGTVTFSCTVTDSRGKTAQASISANVADYAPPTLNAQAERADPDGTVSAQGIKIKVGAVFSAFNVSGNAITSAVASCRKKGSAAWSAEQTLQSGVDLILDCTANVTEDYEIRIVIIDSVSGRAERMLQVPKGAQHLFHFLTDRAAIGCLAGGAGTFSLPSDWSVVGGRIGGEFNPTIERETPFFYCGKRVYMKDFQFIASGNGGTSFSVTGATMLLEYSAQALYENIAYKLPYITEDVHVSNAHIYNAGRSLTVVFKGSTWGTSVTIKGAVYYIK